MAVPFSSIPQLIIQEAIAMFQGRYGAVPDASQQIDDEMADLALKPGFVLASQIMRNVGDTYEGFDGLCRFISGPLCQVAFSTQLQATISQSKQLTITFDNPPMIGALIPKGDEKWGAIERQWASAIASFIRGVFVGALVHFGWKGDSNHDFRGGSLVIMIRLEELDGTWEFAVNGMRRT